MYKEMVRYLIKKEGIETEYDFLIKYLLDRTEPADIPKRKEKKLIRQKNLLEYEEFNNTTIIKKRTPTKQDWPTYYQYCKQEKLLVYKIISDALEDLNVPEEQSTSGRPKASYKDIIKALCIMTYSRLSTWRLDSELHIAYSFGFINRLYKRSSLSKYQNNEEITQYLTLLYQKIAEPLLQVETKLAVDATGMGLSYSHKRWLEVRTEYQKHKQYKKLHIVTGCKTNVIFSALITEGNKHDSPLLKPLIKQMNTSYAEEFSADPAYLSRENVQLIHNCDMTPYILPKKNVRTLNKGVRSGGSWARMIKLWKNHKELFALHYHQRSNVESTFSALKRKFGKGVRSKSTVGQTNEILTKICCFNACALAESLFAYHHKPEFIKYGRNQ